MRSVIFFGCMWIGKCINQPITTEHAGFIATVTVILLVIDLIELFHNFTKNK